MYISKTYNDVDTSNIYNTLYLKELQNEYPHLLFVEYNNTLKVSGNIDLDEFEKLDEILKTI